jgi:nicotine blue oxidoreductase
VLERLAETSVDEVVVVEGAHELEPDDTIRLVRCPAWMRGPGASLRCGLAALDDEVEAVVVVLADGPNLNPATVARVLAEWRAQGGIVAAAYGAERGHPLVLGRDDWDDIPDEGLRDLPVRLVPCDDLGAPGDVDVPEDLDAV